ncbi:MAG: ArsR/SmtB family transcription factor [Candidatus Thorarchaeota archaeon]
MKLMALLADPIRTQIYMHVLLNGEINAQQLMEHLPIVRSTLTHHLSKFVKAEVFKVRVEALGRPTKYYSLKEMKREIMVKDESSEENLRKHILILESAASHLQIVTHIARERARLLGEQLEEKKKSDPSKTLVSFTFNLFNEKAAKIWNREIKAFNKSLSQKLKGLQKTQDTKERNLYVAVSGLFPIIRENE